MHDSRWADEGPDYDSITIKNKQGVEIKAGLGICNDLFRGVKGKGWCGNYFGKAHQKSKVDVILFVTAFPKLKEKLED